MSTNYQAYLGAEKPETLAAGSGEPGAEYGVVRQDYTTGEVTWTGAYRHYGEAMKAIQAVTTHLGFGILTRLRETPATEYTFTNGIPVVKAVAHSA